MMFEFSKIGSFAETFIESSEGWFLQCSNIETECHAACLLSGVERPVPKGMMIQ